MDSAAWRVRRVALAISPMFSTELSRRGFFLPSPTREGSGEGLSNQAALREDRPSPSPSRKREGNA